MSFSPTNSDILRDAQKPLDFCPDCGSELTTRVSMACKGRSYYRNKRKTQVCGCGFSHIIPTEREAMIQLGFID